MKKRLLCAEQPRTISAKIILKKPKLQTTTEPDLTPAPSSTKLPVTPFITIQPKCAPSLPNSSSKKAVQVHKSFNAPSPIVLKQHQEKLTKDFCRWIDEKKQEYTDSNATFIAIIIGESMFGKSVLIQKFAEKWKNSILFKTLDLDFKWDTQNSHDSSRIENLLSDIVNQSHQTLYLSESDYQKTPVSFVENFDSYFRSIDQEETLIIQEFLQTILKLNQMYQLALSKNQKPQSNPSSKQPRILLISATFDPRLFKEIETKMHQQLYIKSCEASKIKLFYLKSITDDLKPISDSLTHLKLVHETAPKVIKSTDVDHQSMTFDQSELVDLDDMQTFFQDESRRLELLDFLIIFLQKYFESSVLSCTLSLKKTDVKDQKVFASVDKRREMASVYNEVSTFYDYVQNMMIFQDFSNKSSVLRDEQFDSMLLTLFFGSGMKHVCQKLKQEFFKYFSTNHQEYQKNRTYRDKWILRNHKQQTKDIDFSSLHNPKNYLYYYSPPDSSN